MTQRVVRRSAVILGIFATGYVVTFGIVISGTPGLEINVETAYGLLQSYLYYTAAPIAFDQLVLVPLLFDRHRIKSYLACLALFIFVYAGILTLLLTSIKWLYVWYFVGKIIWTILVGWGVFLLVRQVRDQQRQREREVLQRDQELRYLRQQMNPHFLFNALNTIYALARTESKDTATAVVELSELLRYTLGGSRADSVPLTDEIAFLNRYLLIAEFRMGEHCTIDFDLGDVPTDLAIAPLLFLPLVENAFKHGVAPSRPDCAISIELAVEGSTLHFAIRNTRVPSATPSTEIGLENLRRRLELQYPKRHHLVAGVSQGNGGEFEVDLTIELERCAA